MQWLDDLLAAAPEDTPLRGEALLWASAVGARQGGSLPRMFALAERSLEIFRAQGDPLGHAFAAYWLAMIGFVYVVELSRIDTLLAESLALAQEAGFAPGCASVIHMQSVMAWFGGDHTRARALLEISLAQYRADEGDPGLCFPLVNPLFRAPGYGSGELARIPIWEETGLNFRWVTPRLAIGYVLASLGILARVEGDFARARSRLGEALAHFRDLEDRQGIAQTLAQLGHVATSEGNYVLARACLEESQQQRREVGEQRGIALGLAGLGILAAVEGDYARARTQLEESLAVVSATADTPGEMGALRNLAYLALCEHDFSRAQALLTEARGGHRDALARERAFVETTQVIVARLQGDRIGERGYLQEAMALHRKRGDWRSSGAALADLGALDLDDGDHAAAREHFAESLTLARAVDDRHTLTRALEGVAALAAERHPKGAIQLAGAVAVLTPARQDALEQMLRLAREAVGDGAYAVAWATGRTTSDWWRSRAGTIRPTSCA